MESKVIQKYSKKSIKDLLPIATRHFNKFIRERDSEDGWGRCISSGRRMRVPSKNAQAGHFYSAGKYPELRFNENNVHLQSKSDNYFLSGNLLEYRSRLIKKIGLHNVEELDEIARRSKQMRYKWDRFYLIEIIEKYKQLNKE